MTLTSSTHLTNFLMAEVAKAGRTPNDFDASRNVETCREISRNVEFWRVLSKSLLGMTRGPVGPSQQRLRR